MVSRLPPHSTLKLPSPRQLARFRLSDVKDDDVGIFVGMGWSLAIACQNCSRLIEWTPEVLQEKFAPTERIADIASRLTCSGPEGCGSPKIAVWPHSRAADLEKARRKAANQPPKAQGDLF